jgi:hypothetical protein
MLHEDAEIQLEAPYWFTDRTFAQGRADRRTRRRPRAHRPGLAHHGARVRPERVVPAAHAGSATAWSRERMSMSMSAVEGLVAGFAADS